MYSVRDLKIIADEDFQITVNHDSVLLTQLSSKIDIAKVTFHGGYGLFKIEDKIKQFAREIYFDLTSYVDELRGIEYKTSKVYTDIINILKRNMVIA